MKIWINAGELSGDIQAAALLKALKDQTSVEASGMGGDNLQEAGMDCVLRVESLSVMGVMEVLGYLPRAVGMLRRIGRELEARRPDAVILVDAPDFNFFVARKAKKLGIPVYYFIPPKIWAWRTGRVHFLREHVRKIFAILPFEVDFYHKHGVNVEYVGNPLVKLVDFPSISAIEPIPGRIGLMPGSRKKEVETLLPAFSGAADILHQKFPELSFHLVRAPHFSEEYLRSFWNSKASLIMESPENRYAFMRTCTAMLAASGTATLETALAGVPTIVAYKVSPLSMWIARRVVKVPYISLTNLIMDREVFPEHIQEDADPQPLAERLESWLSNAEKLNEIRRDCQKLRELCGDAGSAERAARILLNDLVSR